MHHSEQCIEYVNIPTIENSTKRYIVRGTREYNDHNCKLWNSYMDFNATKRMVAYGTLQAIKYGMG